MRLVRTGAVETSLPIDLRRGRRGEQQVKQHQDRELGHDLDIRIRSRRRNVQIALARERRPTETADEHNTAETALPMRGHFGPCANSTWD